LSDGTTDGKSKKRGWRWWLGFLLVLGILADDDNDPPNCSVGDEGFRRAIAQAVGQWTVGDAPLYATRLSSTQTDELGVVLFSVSVAADNGWKGTAQGSVRLRRCRATVDRVEEQRLHQP
jgi:hypothetical protein